MATVLEMVIGKCVNCGEEMTCGNEICMECVFEAERHDDVIADYHADMADHRDWLNSNLMSYDCNGRLRRH